PMVIFSSVRLGVSPQINALATIVVVLVTIGILIAGGITLRAERQRQADRRRAGE
ncbi:MAG: putrescine ABC transporter permease PotI, partial [Alphaproteobacteria bacterium]|nr:putrescine ABC transporter permease PotI [Alphaproteobacteria bacterium]